LTFGENKKAENQQSRTNKNPEKQKINLVIERIELESHWTPNGDDHLLLVCEVSPVDDEETT